MAKVRVGVIGLGQVAQIIHLPILQAMPDRYEVRAVCDVSPGLVQAMGERYGVDGRHTDATALVARPDLDAVFVLTSDEYHAEHTIAAARQGKHVLVEKPMCLTLAEAEAIIQARDEAGVQVMVAYMRRFAPAFTRAKDEIPTLGPITYARVRDIIGQNRLIIEQSSTVLRFADIPAAATDDRTERAHRLVQEAIGEASREIMTAYRLLLGLGSHDLSAMRELLGAPARVVASTQWNGGQFLVAIFAYDGYHVTFEMGVDEQRRFDALIEVFGASKSLRVAYDTPYIRHLPTTLTIHETSGDAFTESVIRPTFKDPYTYELEAFHEVVTKGTPSKSPPEDFVHDLTLFREIVDALRAA